MHGPYFSSTERRRWLVIALGALVLCSCRGPECGSGLVPSNAATPSSTANPQPASDVRLVGHHHAATRPAADHALGAPTTMLPANAFTGGPPQGFLAGMNGDCAPGCHECEDGLGRCGNWAPPGIPCPWPADEWICDGGDREQPVQVSANWNVRGLDTEDTVVHYDTLGGRTIVEPSNRVCIYSPRFASVRKITNPFQNEKLDHLVNSRITQPLSQQQHNGLATTAVQPLQPVADVGLKVAQSVRDRLMGVGLHNMHKLAGFHYGFLPYENLQLIRLGIYESGEQARLAESAQNAVVWTSDQAVQVILDERAPLESRKSTRPEMTYEYDRQGKPCLRIAKVASKRDALSGETVEFTLRFDNLGDEAVGNVTIVDNLIGRLEYVPNSAQCSVDAQFFSVENDQESLVLRWEIQEPLKPGAGGIIRFHCRVR